MWHSCPWIKQQWAALPLLVLVDHDEAAHGGSASGRTSTGFALVCACAFAQHIHKAILTNAVMENAHIRRLKEVCDSIRVITWLLQEKIEG
jgi:hypothetical protein